jgi:hypothetical protein
VTVLIPGCSANRVKRGIKPGKWVEWFKTNRPELEGINWVLVEDNFVQRNHSD